MNNLLDDCNDIISCEKRLTELYSNITLISNIPITEEDINRLSNFIKKEISVNISKGTNFLQSKTPTCLVVLLTFLGKYYDKEIGYWPIVEGKIGKLDINWQTRWGQFFLDYLEKKSLNKFDDEEGLTYVTPILGHAGIPYCCLEEYFDNIIKPLVEHELLNPFDIGEIQHTLITNRRLNSKRLELENLKNKILVNLENLQITYKEVTNKINQLDDIQSLLHKEKQLSINKIHIRGLENAVFIRSNLIKQIEGVEQKIKILKRKKESLVNQFNSFSNREKTIIENEIYISRIVKRNKYIKKSLINAKNNQEKNLNNLLYLWESISDKPWNDEFSIALSDLPIEQIIEESNQLTNLRIQQKKHEDELEGLLHKQKELLSPDPRIFSRPMYYFGKTLVWLGKFPPSSRLLNFGKRIIEFSIIGSLSKLEKFNNQKNQIDNLYSKRNKLIAEIKSQQEKVTNYFNNLPVNNQLLTNQSIDLTNKLRVIRDAFLDYISSIKKSEDLSIIYREFTEKSVEFAYQLDISINNNLDKTFIPLIEALVNAHKYQKIANKAIKIISEQVNPVIIKYQKDLNKIKYELSEINEKLEDLGNGSIQKGIELVEDFHIEKKEIESLKKGLSIQCPNWSRINKEFDNRGYEKIKTEYERELKKLSSEIKITKESICSLEEQLGYYPIQYQGIDEPIRRFLLYGSTSALEFLTNSVLLFATIKNGEDTHQNQDLNLPTIVIDYFIQWWNSQKKIKEINQYEEGNKPTTGQRISNPFLYFDPSMVEIKLKIPEQRFIHKTQNTIVKLIVCDRYSQENICELNIKLFISSNGFVETHSDEYIIPTPSESYQLILKDNDHLIHIWNIDMPRNGKFYLAFSDKTQKLIFDEFLPKTFLNFLVKNDLIFEPKDCVLVEGGKLFGNWKNYNWYQLDLRDVEELYLINNNDIRIPILVASHIEPTLELVGGVLLGALSSKEQPVYSSAPDFLRVPVDNQSELSYIKISLLYGDRSKPDDIKHFQLDVLMDVINDHIDHGWIEVKLKNNFFLGENPMGSFLIRLYKPPYIEWQKSFCIVPNLSITSDKELYIPYQEKPLYAIVSVKFPQNVVFTPNKPAIVKDHSHNTWEIQVPLSENEISGEFSFDKRDGIKKYFPLSISIPKVRWRLQGVENYKYDQWIDYVVDEVWIGDWFSAPELFLVVDIPRCYNGQASLLIQENSAKVEKVGIQNNKARFDLKALEDVLRAGPSLKIVNLSLTCENSNIPKFPLFSIRTCWEAQKIRCFQHLEDDRYIFEITWNEQGLAEQKIVRLWHYSNPPRLVNETLVAKDKTDVLFEVATNQIETGDYIVHIEPYDPWIPEQACPSLKDKNIIVIKIDIKKPVEIVEIKSVCVNNKRSYYFHDSSYKIKILGKVSNLKLPEQIEVNNMEQILVTPLNEDWYVGKLEVEGIQEVIEYLNDTNPVKFEYDPIKNIITSIEDRHGDGAMYCFDCKMLFWSQETLEKEKKRKHRNYGPIEQFSLVWETEEEILD